LLLLLGVLAAVLLSRFSRQALTLLFGVVIISEAWTAMMGGRSMAADPLVRTASAMPAKAEFAIVHLVLDEHIGLEGIPDSAPRGAEMRGQLRKFYLDHGFRIFGGAYSESLHTVNAIPRALGLESPGAWKARGKGGTILERNSYFDSLQSMGFTIDVTQTDWVDYCRHPAVEGRRTDAAGGLIDVGDELPTTDKAAILVYRFAELSRIGRGAFRLYDTVAFVARRLGLRLQPVQLRKRTLTSTLNAMASFEAVVAEARSLAPGKAIFAHILLPHYPYVYDQACGTRRVSDWVGRASASSWERRYTAYFDQVVCATSKVEALLAAVAASPAAGRTVVIIHGDHGSRIMRVEATIENDGAFSGRDLVDGHAAFFAVAAPGIEPGYRAGRYPLRILLAALVRSRFRALEPDLPAGFVPTIAIEDRNKTPVTERPVADVEWWSTPSGASPLERR
jgi:hypothetical protein